MVGGVTWFGLGDGEARERIRVGKSCRRLGWAWSYDCGTPGNADDDVVMSNGVTKAAHGVFRGESMGEAPGLAAYSGGVSATGRIGVCVVRRGL